MRKKVALIVLFCCLIAMSLTCFIACDKKDTVEVKVYSVSSAHDENPELKNTITIKKGSTFSKSDYFKNYVKDNKEDGNVAAWGFYLDPACTKKHNDDNVLDKDTSLYVLYSYFGAKFVKFEYEGKEYFYYVDDATEKLTADTFEVSAYGKKIDSSKLQYFSDKEMTQQVEIVGKSFDEIEIEADDTYFTLEKRVYVKYVA